MTTLNTAKRCLTINTGNLLLKLLSAVSITSNGAWLQRLRGNKCTRVSMHQENLCCQNGKSLSHTSKWKEWGASQNNNWQPNNESSYTGKKKKTHRLWLLQIEQECPCKQILSMCAYSKRLALITIIKRRCSLTLTIVKEKPDDRQITYPNWRDGNRFVAHFSMLRMSTSNRGLITPHWKKETCNNELYWQNVLIYPIHTSRRGEWAFIFLMPSTLSLSLTHTHTNAWVNRTYNAVDLTHCTLMEQSRRIV